MSLLYRATATERPSERADDQNEEKKSACMHACIYAPQWPIEERPRDGIETIRTRRGGEKEGYHVRERGFAGVQLSHRP